MTIVKVQGPIPKKLAHRRRTTPRNGTKAGKLHMALVATLPCSLYVNWGNECEGRTTVAHKDGAGMALKSSDFETMALCEAHHLFGRHSIAQMGIKAWERKYGSQTSLIGLTNHRLKRCFPE